MQIPFPDKNGNLLEKGTLYNLPLLSWPLSFQGYEYRQEGPFKKFEAVFWDFKGLPHYFSQKKIASLATKTALEQTKQYLTSAKSLVDWLSIQESKIAQSPSKLTEETLEQKDEGSLGKHPFRKDDGFVHPNKRY